LEKGAAVENYEGLFIIKPDIKEEDAKGVLKVITEALVKNGGAVKKEDIWGKRQLAYPVKKFKEGFYYKLEFTASTSSIAKLEETYRLNADILRTMITRR